MKRIEGVEWSKHVNILKRRSGGTFASPIATMFTHLPASFFGGRGGGEGAVEERFRPIGQDSCTAIVCTYINFTSPIGGANKKEEALQKICNALPILRDNAYLQSCSNRKLK